MIDPAESVTVTCFEHMVHLAHHFGLFSRVFWVLEALLYLHVNDVYRCAGT